MEQTTNVSPDVGQQPAPNHASEVVKRKRPRGKPSETNREEAKRILTLFLRYERPMLKRLGDDREENAPGDWHAFMGGIVTYPPPRASRLSTVQCERCVMFVCFTCILSLFFWSKKNRNLGFLQPCAGYAIGLLRRIERRSMRRIRLTSSTTSPRLSRGNPGTSFPRIFTSALCVGFTNHPAKQ